MKTTSALILLAILVFMPGATQELPRSLKVPETEVRPVVIDGVFDPDEWSDALNVSEGAPVDILLKMDRHHVFIGIRCSSQELPVLDVFLDPSGPEAFQLHASSYLADRVLPENDLMESKLSTDLGLDWTANEVTWDSKKRGELVAVGVYGQEMLKQVVHPFDGFELRIRRSQFRSSRWFLMVQLMTFAGSDPPLVFPLDANPEIRGTWLLLDVGAEEGLRAGIAPAHHAGRVDDGA